MSKFLYSPEVDFPAFGTEHLLLVILFSMITFVTIYLAKKKWSPGFQKRYIHGVAWSLAVAIVLYTMLRWYVGTFDKQEDLPLFLCNLIALAMPFFTRTLNSRVFEVIYFWILGGTLQALITPDLYHPFPHFIYWKYWYVHFGLVYVVLYTIFIFGQRPYLSSIWKSILWLEVYFVFILIINYLLGSNYCYLNEKPEMGSILDLFGPWPIYILVAQLLLIPVFFLLYLPYFIKDKLIKSRR